MCNPLYRSGLSWSGLFVTKKGDCRLESVQGRTRKVTKRMDMKGD